MKVRLLLVPRLLFSILLLPILAIASPPPPCVRATASRNGNFLVLSDIQTEPEQGQIRGIKRVTLNVLTKEELINEKDRVIGPGLYWEDRTQWSVTLDPKKGSLGCPLSLITDDGEFLVVLGGYDARAFALSIYRRREHPGQLTVKEGPDTGVHVKDVRIEEIWPSDKLREPLIMTDATPQWFAGGTFHFSPDNRALIHKTRWGTVVKIALTIGEVSRNQ